MGVQEMMMVFFTSTTTALYSVSWRPKTKAQYAGTCIFLAVLAMTFRILLALRSHFPEFWARFKHEKIQDGYERLTAEPDHDLRARQKWTVSGAASRAALDVILAGISYLL